MDHRSGSLSGSMNGANSALITPTSHQPSATIHGRDPSEHILQLWIENDHADTIATVGCITIILMPWVVSNATVADIALL